MVDMKKVTNNQEYIMARHSRMIGKVLDIIEACLPEGNQLDKLKRLMNNPMYDFRNEMLKMDEFGVPEDYK
tara:strand:+ start:1539 stop:1751 length:213 start_codon:yes stop_codon:yes gene_type:complete